MSDYSVKDNTDEVIAALGKGIKRGLEAVGITAEKYAKKYETAVDTGCYAIPFHTQPMMRPLILVQM